MRTSNKLNLRCSFLNSSFFLKYLKAEYLLCKHRLRYHELCVSFTKIEEFTYSFHKTAAVIFIQNLAASDLAVCGSSTVHIYTHIMHRKHNRHKQYMEQHNQFENSAGRASSLRVIPWHLPYN